MDRQEMERKLSKYANTRGMSAKDLRMLYSKHVKEIEQPKKSKDMKKKWSLIKKNRANEKNEEIRSIKRSKSVEWLRENGFTKAGKRKGEQKRYNNIELFYTPI